MIRALDRNVGRVLQSLKDQGLDDDTLVIFTSDNGGAHYIGIDGLNSPYRGWKATFFEGGIRVPLIISGIAGMPKDRIAHSLAHVNDIVPTLLDLAQVARPGNQHAPFAGGEAFGRVQGEHPQLPDQLHRATGGDRLGKILDHGQAEIDQCRGVGKVW
jgi:arylsulfatase A-like enzyme